MTPAALISAIRAAGVEPIADGDRILLRPPGKLPADLRAQLVAAKPAVLGFLQGRPTSSLPCTGCGSTSWVAALVARGGARTCADCATGLTALRRNGVAI